ncbi:hypothetical protein BGW80DRAFT_1457912 [Lactifluus volemus]|nr:hypothetical protein BGW80DRAFT_1457912 [Lactifluus volemus]
MVSQEKGREDSDLLDRLYPVPLSTGVVSLPGPTDASARALLNVLLHNREHYHIFYNYRGFQNHVTHHVLAIYGLGASPEIIEDAYRTTRDHLKPAFRSPEPITDQNFTKHLGDAQYYSAFLDYFSEYLRDHAPNEAFERFVLSSPYNFGPDVPVQDINDAEKEENKHPEMLNRFMAGISHPLIHLAYGIEFGLPGQVAEGLACAAVHKSGPTVIVPHSFFAKPADPGLIASLTSKLSILRVATPAFQDKRPTFAFHRRIRDKFNRNALDVDSSEPADTKYIAVLTNSGDAIVTLVSEWADQWLQGTHSHEQIEKRLEGMVEEVVWGNVIWFGVGGWQSRGNDRSFNADFFVVHLVTSSIFLLTLVLPSERPYPLVPLASRLTLLKAYLATSAAWYISRGNSPLPIKEFYAATHDRLTAPPATPAPPSAPRKPLSAPGGPWERIIANTIAHPDDHLCKAVRSFATFSTRWGSRPADYYAGGGDDGLEGREVLDGTLFSRVASLTLDRLGWAHESGRDLGQWDHDGVVWSNDDE